MVEIRRADAGVVEIEISAHLSREDYGRIGAELDRASKERPGVRVLVLARDFQGWTYGGIWEELKFDGMHPHQVRKLAMVGEPVVREDQGAFQHPLAADEFRQFASGQEQQARQWLLS